MTYTFEYEYVSGISIKTFQIIVCRFSGPFVTQFVCRHVTMVIAKVPVFVLATTDIFLIQGINFTVHRIAQETANMAHVLPQMNVIVWMVIQALMEHVNRFALKLVKTVFVWLQKHANVQMVTDPKTVLAYLIVNSVELVPIAQVQVNAVVIMAMSVLTIVVSPSVQLVVMVGLV